MFRKLIFLFLFLLAAASTQLSAQTVVLNEIGMSIKFPKNYWKKFASMKPENAGDPSNHLYKRTDFITDDLSVTVIASIFIEEISEGTSLFDYSTEKRKDLPFKVTHIYNQKLLGCKYKEVTGFRGLYSDKNTEPTIAYLVYIVKGNKGMQLMIQCSSAPPEKLEKEIRKIIKSLKSTVS